MAKTLFAAIAALTLVATPAFAHHPFAAEYDWKKPVTLTGTVQQLNWANPHVEMTIDAKDQAGTSGTWKVELGSPAALQKYNLSKADLKAGDRITVEGWMAKDGTKQVNAKSITLANGRLRQAASSFFDQGAEAAATSGSK